MFSKNRRKKNNLKDQQAEVAPTVAHGPTDPVSERQCRKTIARHRKLVNSMLHIPHWDDLYENGLKTLELPQPRRGINLRSVLDSLLLENKFRLIIWIFEQNKKHFPALTANKISDRMGINLGSNKAKHEGAMNKDQWSHFKEQMDQALSHDHKHYKKAQTVLFRRYQTLIHKLVNRQVFDANKRQDAFQEASLGLLHAIDKVEDSQASFGSYARTWVSRHIKNFLMGEHFPVHVPINLASKILRKNSQDEKQEHEHLENLVKPGVSIDEMNDAEDGSSQQIADNSGITPSESLTEKDLHSTVYTFFDALTNKQREVLKLRYGLKRETGSETLANIANKVGISHQQVSMREKRALQKLETVLKPLYKEIYD